MRMSKIRDAISSILDDDISDLDLSDDELVDDEDSIEEVEVTTLTNKSPAEIRPTKKIRYDQIGHFPQHSGRGRNASRCKNEYCNGKSRWRCIKCNVHLCLNSRTNCFLSFHTKKDFSY